MVATLGTGVNCAAVRKVFTLLRGGTHLTPDPKVITVSEFRQREVVWPGIAESLGVGTVTVKNTIYRMQGKLGVAVQVCAISIPGWERLKLLHFTPNRTETLPKRRMV